MTSPDTIKQALRECETLADVDRVADQYRADVKALHAGPDKALALQIANLKSYRIWQLRNPE